MAIDIHKIRGRGNSHSEKQKGETEARTSTPGCPVLAAALLVLFLIGVSAFSAMIGPLGVTYYARIHGKFVPYQPSGIILPARCPRRGFPFAITFKFADGSGTTSGARVPCPQHPRRARR